MARRSLVGWVVALAFLCSACAVDVTVTVKVREDGSGAVSVDVVADAEAVAAVEVGGGTLEDRVRLTDLPAAGWTVGGWDRGLDGSASLTVRKPFTSVDEIPGILDELSGANGPLRESSFRRERSFFETRYDAEAVVDLGAATTGITQDADLVGRLAAEGLDVAALDQQLLAKVRDSLTVRLVVDLPGAGKTVIEPAPGQSASLTASSSLRDTTRIVLVVVAAGLVVGALLVVLWPRRKRRKGGGVGPQRHHLPEAPHSAYQRRGDPPVRRGGAPAPRRRPPWPEPAPPRDDPAPPRRRPPWPEP